MATRRCRMGNNPKAVEWLGDQLAADPRFAVGAVHYWHKALFHREPLQAVTDTTGPDAASRLAAYDAQQQEFKEIAARFAANGYKVKDLLVDLILSKQSRRLEQVSAQRAASLVAMGKGHLLSTSRLQRKFMECLDCLTSPSTTRLLARVWRSAALTPIPQNPQVDFTTNQVTTLDVALLTMSLHVMADFGVTPAARCYPAGSYDGHAGYPGGQGQDPGQHRAATTSCGMSESPPQTPVQRTYQLFESVYNDRATARTPDDLPTERRQRRGLCRTYVGHHPDVHGRQSRILDFLIG